MIPYPDIKPYLIKIGPFELRWYGLMYLFGFAASYLLVQYRIKKERLPVDKKTIEDIYFYLILALIIGARLG
ncbi:MAG: prolipoprotein diacylglyceryl transferase, partial [Nitrospirae bacterium]